MVGPLLQILINLVDYFYLASQMSSQLIALTLKLADFIAIFCEILFICIAVYY
jgi:hypothetical protein